MQVKQITAFVYTRCLMNQEEKCACECDVLKLIQFLSNRTETINIFYPNTKSNKIQTTCLKKSDQFFPMNFLPG